MGRAASDFMGQSGLTVANHKLIQGTQGKDQVDAAQ